jgi:hypothetical protein
VSDLADLTNSWAASDRETGIATVIAAARRKRGEWKGTSAQCTEIRIRRLWIGDLRSIDETEQEVAGGVAFPVATRACALQPRELDLKPVTTDSYYVSRAKHCGT